MNNININDDIEKYYRSINKEQTFLEEYEKKNKISSKKKKKNKISHLNFTSNNKKKLGIKDNLLQWPSIKQLHRFIIHYLKRINRNISNKTLTKSNASDDINKLFDSKVSAVEKIDGSNFGIDSDGRLFGRRTELGFSFKTFKGCDVEKLRDFDVIGIHKELSTYLNPANMNFDNNDNTLKNVRLYGELSCYPELYKYKKRSRL